MLLTSKGGRHLFFRRKTILVLTRRHRSPLGIEKGVKLTFYAFTLKLEVCRSHEIFIIKNRLTNFYRVWSTVFR